MVSDDVPWGGGSDGVVVVAGGVWACGRAWAAAVTSLVRSLVALRNSRMALPAAEPSSGRRPGPKMIRTITSATTSQSG